MSEEEKDKRIRDLENKVEQLSKMLIKSFNYAEQDPDTFLQNARKTTEAICRFIYVHEVGEPKKKMLLNDLARELRSKKLVPDRILILIGTIQTYGNYGAHAQDEFEEATKEWIAPCQTALANLTNWFFVEYLHGKVPMPEELAEPVKERANENMESEGKRASKGGGSSKTPVIGTVVFLLVLSAVLLIWRPWETSSNSNDPHTAERKAQSNQEGDNGRSNGSDIEAKENMAESKTSSAIDSLNESAGKGASKRVAILYFENTGGSQELSGLRKGLAGMMISDLSKVERLQVVERNKLQEVLEEQELSNSEKFDPSTAAKVGKLLGAEQIMIGSYFEMMGKLRIDARMIDVETGEILYSEGLDGKKDELFKLEQDLVRKIVGQLDLEEGKGNMKGGKEVSYEAASLYSQGLDLMDKGKVEEARKRFQKALDIEPSFEPAQKALKRTDFPS